MRGFEHLTGALVALLTSSALAAPACAQSQPPQEFAQVDQNGVDLTTGQFFFSLTEGAIGDEEGGVSLVHSWAGQAGWVDNWSGVAYQTTNAGQPVTYVEFGPISDTFTTTDGVNYVSRKGDGSKLTGGGFPASLTYTGPDGTSINYLGGYDDGRPFVGPRCGSGGCYIPTAIAKPDGHTFTLEWEYAPYFQNPSVSFRLLSVTSNANYRFDLTYKSNNSGTLGAPPPDWFKRATIAFSNSASAPVPLPTITYGGTSGFDITDTGGRLWKIVTGPQGPTGIRRPGSAADNISVTYNTTTGLVSSVIKDGVTTNYSRNVSGNTITMTRTNALSQQTVVTSDTTVNRPLSAIDALNRTTSFQYDTNRRPTRSTLPEGNYKSFTYDGRGNVTERRVVAKAGSGLADIVATESYSATCSNPKTCNQPNSSTDPRGNVTDYTYDASHGGVLTVTKPAAPNGVRPQTVFTYTLQSGVNLLSGVSACQTLAAGTCTSGIDQTKTSIVYNSSNLLPIIVSSGNGTGTLTATSSLAYDSIGNLVTIDGPLTGAADTTKLRYNASREEIGTVSPDPDGAGLLKHRAVRNTYRGDGQISKQELGTVNSQSDPDWAAFAPLQTVDLTFDSNSRPTTIKLSGGGTAYALTQSIYDTLGRPDCTTQRMNTAIYGSLPASACTPGTQGSFGPDRIGKTIYDAAGQVTQAQVALGTAGQANERTLTYSNNGNLATLKDAENNRTTYEYDGFDRLSKTRMPDTTKGAGTSSTTDYEQLTYDAASNVTNNRLRDAQNIAFTYENLNRTTLKNLPGSELDVTYAYDNLGRLTSASQTGNALSFTYDALSRNLTQVGPQGTVSSVYDPAGRRTQLTYPGSGLFVTYDYLVTGETTAIRENGAASGIGVLATFGYDDLGRRTNLARGNSTVTTYGYDPVSRLVTLAENMTGTTNDQNATFTYNPASQIGGVTRANDLYAWTGHGSGSTASAVNGLNQLTSIGGAATAHDARGNLTTDPTSGKTYSYSSENLLTGASGGVTLGYDPATRLYQIAGASTTRFGYDGLDMILEANASNAIQRRFVHGPGVDQPLVQYEGPSTTDRRWLHADERGSVIAVSDGGGNVTTINRYDEFGKPQSTNAGRFQYTGQAWLPEIGAYYYKARMYGPALGQFLQTDPIGTDGGVNLYVYVGNDPVNALDPLGLGPPCPGGEDPITVCGMRLGALSFAGGASGGGGTGGGGGAQVPGSTSLPPTVDQGSYPNSHNDPPAPVDTIVVEAPRIRKLLSIGRLILSRAGLIITYLQLSGDSCTVCSNVEFPTDKSNLGHIFSGKSGHFSKDTPNNRKAIKSTVSQKYFIGRKVGVDVYRQTLPNGSQVWVEVYNGTVSNAGINSIPIYGF